MKLLKNIYFWIIITDIFDSLMTYFFFVPNREMNVIVNLVLKFGYDKTYFQFIGFGIITQILLAYYILTFFNSGSKAELFLKHLLWLLPTIHIIGGLSWLL